MKIEKLDDNKLKVVFSIKELEKENIDYQSFMSGSNKFENIISNLLYIAKDKLDFDTNNCNVEVETLEITQGNFVLTITKFEKKENKLKTKRKTGNIRNNSCIYEFCNFDNYLEFIYFLESNFINLYYTFQKHSELYCLQKKYILIINGDYFSDEEISVFNSSITEFATFKSNSKILILKIKETHDKIEQKNI